MLLILIKNMKFICAYRGNFEYLDIFEFVGNILWFYVLVFYNIGTGPDWLGELLR